jgi:hypothetical protein
VVANDADVALPAVVAYEALDTDPDCATVTENCEPSPLVKVIVVSAALAVTTLLVASEDVSAYELLTEELDEPLT